MLAPKLSLLILIKIILITVTPQLTGELKLELKNDLINYEFMNFS